MIRPQDHRLLEYFVEAVIGHGGFGTTCLCRDEKRALISVESKRNFMEVIRIGANRVGMQYKRALICIEHWFATGDPMSVRAAHAHRSTTTPTG